MDEEWTNQQRELWLRKQMEMANYMFQRSPEVKPEPPKQHSHVWVFHTIVAVVGLGCLIYWGNGNHLAVEVPVYDAATLQRLQQENALLSRKLADYKALSANLAGRLKEANGRLAKLEEERNVLAHSSLPPQPVILEAIRKEAATERGLRQVVARSFGADIAKRIQVIQ